MNRSLQLPPPMSHLAPAGTLKQGASFPVLSRCSSLSRTLPSCRKKVPEGLGERPQLRRETWERVSAGLPAQLRLTGSSPDARFFLLNFARSGSCPPSPLPPAQEDQLRPTSSLILGEMQAGQQESRGQLLRRFFQEWVVITTVTRC